MKKKEEEEREEEEKEEEEEEEEEIYTYTDTPGLETLVTIFKKYAINTKLTMLLIVVRTGGVETYGKARQTLTLSAAHR